MSGFLQILLYSGAIQGFLFSIGLISLPSNKNSNRILALLTLIWGIVLFAYAKQEDNFYFDHPHLLLVFDQLILLIFPLYYLFAKYLLSALEKFQRIDLWHFLPFLLSLIAHIDFFMKSGEEKLNSVLYQTDYLPHLEVITNEVVSIQSIAYSILVLKLVHKYKVLLKDLSSRAVRKRIYLVQFGTLLILFFWTISIICLHLSYAGFEIEFDYFSLSYFSLVVFIYVLSFVSFSNTEVFRIDIVNSPYQNFKSDAQKIISLGKKHSENSSEIDQLQELNTALENSMEKEKLYLNPDLNLMDLANHLKVSRNELSKAINSIQRKNFYDFVNQYRVEEVKKLLSDPANKDLKMESLGYSAGFNSKASFYRIFKQSTNISPKQYFNENMGA